MSFLSFDSVVELVAKHYGSEEGDKGEENRILEFQTDRIGFLEIARKLIETQLGSQIHAFFAFQSMSSIYFKYGTLLPINTIMEQIDFIFSCVEQNIDYFFENMNILYKALRSASILIRLIIENDNEYQIQQVTQKISNFEGKGRPEAAVTLLLYQTLVEVMSEAMPCIEPYKAEQKKAEFRDTFFPKFLSIITECVGQEEDPIILKYGLLLLIECFKFGNYIAEDRLELISYSRCFHNMYDEPDFVELLFKNAAFSFDDFEIYNLIYTSLELFLRAKSACYSNLDVLYSCIIEISNKLCELMPSITADCPFMSYFLKVVLRLCYVVQCCDFQTLEFSDFISNLSEFSAISLQSGLENLFLTIRIWTIVSDWALPLDMDRREFDKMIRQMKITRDYEHENSKQFHIRIFEVFKQILEAFDASINQNCQGAIEIIKAQRDMNVFENMWSFNMHLDESFNEFLMSYIQTKKEEFLTTPSLPCFASMYFIISLVRSRQNGMKNLQNKLIKFKSEQNMQDVYDNEVTDFIIKSNPNLQQILEMFPDEALEFESLVNDFINYYQKTHYSVLRVPIRPISEENEEAEIDQKMKFLIDTNPDGEDINVNEKKDEFKQKLKQERDEYDAFINTIHEIINRLYMDFGYFQTQENSGSFLIQILMTIEQIHRQDKIKEFTKDTDFIRLLYSRELPEITYTPETINELKRVRQRIYYMYAQYLPNRRELLGFLGTFDERINALVVSSQDIEVYQLFQDLLGVLKGLSNPSFLEFFIMWFSEKHVKYDNALNRSNTLTLIEKHKDNQYVVSAIVHLWIMFYKTTQYQNSPHVVEGTGIGITLFKSSYIIADTVSKLSGDMEEHVILFYKLICICLTINIANYGIMNYFGDNSPTLMVQKFFEIFLSVPLEIPLRRLKVAKLLLQACLSILENNPEEIYPHQENVARMIELANTILLDPQDDENIIKYVFKLLMKLLHFAIDQKAQVFIPQFRKSIVYIFDFLINKHLAITFQFVEFLYFYAPNDTDFINHVRDSIISNYDDEFKPEVSKIFHQFMDNPEQIENPKESEKANKDKALKFNRQMRKYPISFQMLPAFSEFY